MTGSKTIVVGIDPGPQKSAVVVWNGEHAANPEWLPNAEVERYIGNEGRWFGTVSARSHLAIERVNYYGRMVGMDVFETAYWSGRFAAPYAEPTVLRINRPDVCRELVGDPRAKKAQVNAYLMDEYGPKGTKKKPGPLFCVSGHIWDALAVAVVAFNRLKGTER